MQNTLKMVQGFLREFRTMLYEEGTRLVESVFAGILILWGGYLLLPLTYRGTDVYTRSYQQISPESAWAGAMLAVGIILLTGTVRDNARMRRASLLMAAMLFMALWSVYFLAGRPSVGLVILPFYSLVSALLFLHPRFRPLRQGGKQHGESGRDHRVGSSDVRDDRRSYQARRHLAGTPQ